MILPKTLNISITSYCQRQCNHCFLWQSGQLNKSYISLKNLKNIIDNAYSNGVFMVSISGGDPFLHPDFYNIIEYISSKNMLPLIGATGENISLEKAKKLKCLGVPCIQVSLDGYNKESNDQLRGNGNFDKVIESISCIQKAGLKTNLAVCLHQQNYKSIKKILTLARELNIYKVKLDLWKPFKSYNTYIYKELTAEQVNYIFEASKLFLKATNTKEWIECPNIKSDNNLRTRSVFRQTTLSINANLEVTAGEWGDSLGYLSNNSSLNQLYEHYHHEKLNDFFDLYVKTLFSAYKINKIEYVDYSKISSAALLLKLSSGFEIYIDDSLPITLKIFTTLHEIGHIAQNTVYSNPKINSNKCHEKNANQWAINFLRPYLKIGYYQYLSKLNNDDESKLYNFIKNYLYFALLNKKELKCIN